MTPLHRCSCGTTYTADTWHALPLSYVRHDDELGHVEARNCPCGSTREVAFSRLAVAVEPRGYTVLGAPLHDYCAHCDRPLVDLAYPMPFRGEITYYCSPACACVCGDCGEAPGVRQAHEEDDGWLLCEACALHRAEHAAIAGALELTDGLGAAQ